MNDLLIIGGVAFLLMAMRQQIAASAVNRTPSQRCPVTGLPVGTNSGSGCIGVGIGRIIKGILGGGNTPSSGTGSSKGGGGSSMGSQGGSGGLSPKPSPGHPCLGPARCPCGVICAGKVITPCSCSVIQQPPCSKTPIPCVVPNPILPCTPVLLPGPIFCTNPAPLPPLTLPCAQPVAPPVLPPSPPPVLCTNPAPPIVCTPSTCSTCFGFGGGGGGGGSFRNEVGTCCGGGDMMLNCEL